MQERSSSDPVDWLLGGLDRVVDGFHDRVLRPLLVITRFLAFGFVLFALSVVVLTAGTIGLLRFATVFLFQGYVWCSYLAVGTIFLVIGLLIWRHRRPAPLRKS